MEAHKEILGEPESNRDQLTRLKKERPVRFFLAVWAGRLIRGLVVIIAAPFFAIGVVVDILHWQVFPFIVRHTSFIPRSILRLAEWVSRKIVGYEPTDH